MVCRQKNRTLQRSLRLCRRQLDSCPLRRGRQSVKAYRESLGILPFFRPAPRKQVLPIGHDLRPYKPLFGYVSDQEIAQLAGVDLDLVQDVREGLALNPSRRC